MLLRMNVWSIDTLLSWLEKQPPEKSYDYQECSDCLFAQYLKAHGWNEPVVGGFDVCECIGPRLYTEDVRLPDRWSDIAHDGKQTFGGALRRAKKLRDALKRAEKILELA